MKNKAHLLNILLAVVVVLLVFQLSRNNETVMGKADVDHYNTSNIPVSDSGNVVLQVIHERKSVRHFTQQKVSDEQILTLIRAGMAAPTAVNMQPWKFIAINDSMVLNSLAAASTYGKMLHHAPAAIAVCGDLSKAFPGEYRDLWIQDCSAASQNILLAAESMGLGAVWTSTYPGKEINMSAIEILNLPEHLIPLNVIAIGYPTGEDKKKNKWKEDNIRWNRW